MPLRARVSVCGSVLLMLLVLPRHAECKAQGSETVVQGAQRGVGWLQHPDGLKGTERGLTFTTATTRTESLAGVGPVVDELFATIVEVAIDRAKNQALVVVHDRLQRGVCDFPKPKSFLSTAALLQDTSALIKSTDLLALIGQAQAFRPAVTGDVTTAAANEFAKRFKHLPVVTASATGSLALVKRFSAEPELKLGANDVRTIAEAFVNTPWAKSEGGTLTSLLPMTKELASVEIGVSSVRVFMVAKQLRTADQETFDEQTDLANQGKRRLNDAEDVRGRDRRRRDHQGTDSRLPEPDRPALPSSSRWRSCTNILRSRLSQKRSVAAPLAQTRRPSPATPIPEKGVSERWRR